MATLHLIHGFIGAGKTTFAQKLEKETNAVRFTHDEWMIAVHGNNPQNIDLVGAVERIRNLIWITAVKFLDRGIDIILDDGFWKRADRDLYRARVAKAGHNISVYHLDVSRNEMKRRALLRTQSMPEGAMFIDENGFEVLWQKFEPLDPDERSDAVLVNS